MFPDTESVGATGAMATMREFSAALVLNPTKSSTRTTIGTLWQAVNANMMKAMSSPAKPAPRTARGIWSTARTPTAIPISAKPVTEQHRRYPCRVEAGVLDQPGCQGGESSQQLDGDDGGHGVGQPEPGGSGPAQFVDGASELFGWSAATVAATAAAARIERTITTQNALRPPGL